MLPRTRSLHMLSYQLGEGCLQQFSAGDYQFDALWSKLSSIFGEKFYETPWTREGQDVWVQKVSR